MFYKYTVPSIICIASGFGYYKLCCKNIKTTELYRKVEAMFEDEGESLKSMVELFDDNIVNFTLNTLNRYIDTTQLSVDSVWIDFTSVKNNSYRIYKLNLKLIDERVVVWKEELIDIDCTFTGWNRTPIIEKNVSFGAVEEITSMSDEESDIYDDKWLD